MRGSAPDPFDRPKAGEWIQPIRHGYLLACCDCGLTHRLDFRVKARRAQFRVFRDNAITKHIRKVEGIRVSTHHA